MPFVSTHIIESKDWWFNDEVAQIPETPKNLIKHNYHFNTERAMKCRYYNYYTYILRKFTTLDNKEIKHLLYPVNRKNEDSNFKNVIGKLLIFSFIFFLIVLPPPTTHATATTFTCYFENYAGEEVKCSDRQPFTKNYPYLIQEDAGFYYISRLGEKLPPIPKEGNHTFAPTYIAWEFKVEKSLPISVRDEVNMKLLPPTNLKQFTYVAPTYRDSNGTAVDIYNDTQLNNKSLIWPLIVTDPWTIDSTAGWNGTHDQTNLDENESVMIDWNHTIFEPYVSYWTMDSFNSTTIFDENTTNYNNGTISGAVDAVGLRNRSRDFDGLNDVITIPDDDTLDGGAGITVSTWIYTKGTPATNFARIITKENGGTDTWQMYIDNNNKINWRIFNSTGSASPTLTTTTVVSNNTWTYIDVMYNGSELSVWFNGVKDATTKSFSGPVRNGGAYITIGDFPELGRPFNGSIDEVKIYNRSLSASEILAEYNGSYYSSGNFTTDERNTTGTEELDNVSVTFTLDGSSSVNLWANDTAADSLELLGTGITTDTNYTSTENPQNYTIIVELINGSTPHIIQINTYERGIPPTINVTSPTNTTYTATNNIPLNVAADETIDQWYYDIGDGNVSFTPNITILYVENGLHQLLVWARDSAGNWGVNDTIWFTINVTTAGGIQFGSLQVISLGGNVTSGVYPGDQWVDEAGDTVAWLEVTEDLNVTGNVNITGNLTYRTIYAQLSDLNDQNFATANVGEPINLTTTDESYGLIISTSNITIQVTGVYDIAAQPQVAAGPGDAGTFHMWLEKHNTTQWVNVSNSNVELTLASNDEDVIPLIVTLKLNAGEKIRLMGSVSDTGIFLDDKTPANEPMIPSIIFRIFKLGD